MNNEKIFGISIIIILIVGTIIIFATQQVVNKYQYENKIYVDSQKVFDLLADVQNFPKVFPKTFQSVKILNQTHNTVYTEEIISYHGITKVIKIKHELKPYQYHTITILSGEFKNTSFIINFNEKDSNTLIIINAEIHFPSYVGLMYNNIPFNFNVAINNLYGEIPIDFRINYFPLA